MVKHQIEMKENKPIKRRYYPKNPNIQRKINAKVDELIQMGLIKHAENRYAIH